MRIESLMPHIRSIEIFKEVDEELGTERYTPEQRIPRLIRKYVT